MTLIDRFAEPPSRRAGVVAALVAAAMMIGGAFGFPMIGLSPDTDQVLLIRLFLIGNIIALLGFVFLLYAVHAVIAQRAAPGWTMIAAYAVLLIRPLALVPEIVAAPIAVLSNLGPISPALPYLLLATTGVAAGLAAYGVLPLAQNAATGGRRAAVAIGVGLLVALALFSFAPYIAPLTALGVAVALSFRSRPEGPAGQD